MLGFRVCFTPRQGCFSVFARATRSLSVYQEYLGLERGRPRFTQDFTSLALLRYRLELTSLRVRAYHPLWDRFPASSARVRGLISPALQPQLASQLVWPLPLSLAATGGISSISSPLATKMFQFTRFASLVRGILRVHRSGLPHSDSPGSSLRCSSPRLFAA